MPARCGNNSRLPLPSAPLINCWINSIKTSQNSKCQRIFCGQSVYEIVSKCSHTATVVEIFKADMKISMKGLGQLLVKIYLKLDPRNSANQFTQDMTKNNRVITDCSSLKPGLLIRYQLNHFLPVMGH